MTVEARQVGDYPVIGRDTDVIGGVFLGRGAVLVDMADNPDPYEEAYARLEQRLPEGMEDEPMEMAHAVVAAVKRTVPFDKVSPRIILRGLADELGVRYITNEVVGLSEFFGGGNCQHQTLFAGAMVQLLRTRRGMEGTASVDVMPLESGFDNPEEDRHTWLRYTRGDDRYVIDASPDAPWHVFRLSKPIGEFERFYLRPEEIEEFVDEDDMTFEDLTRIEAHEKRLRVADEAC